MLNIYINGEYILANCFAVHTYGTAYVPSPGRKSPMTHGANHRANHRQTTGQYNALYRALFNTLFNKYALLYIKESIFYLKHVILYRIYSILTSNHLIFFSEKSAFEPGLLFLQDRGLFFKLDFFL